MVDLTLKRNDTHPTLLITLTEGTPATAINLTTATSAKLLMKTATGSLITRPVAFTNRTLGQITATFQAADTATSGDYSAEVEITWPDGVETVPNDGWFAIKILDDLG